MNADQEERSRAGSLPPRTRRPFRTKRTGRPGGSGAQPPLHLIHMVIIERPGTEADKGMVSRYFYGSPAYG